MCEGAFRPFFFGGSAAAVGLRPVWSQRHVNLAGAPVGGIGINLAIQDAVATANLLAEPLQVDTLIDGYLEALQMRRLPPTKWTQALQVQAHRRVVEPVLNGRVNFNKLPVPLRLLDRHPFLRQFPARILGMGFKPEHVRQSIIHATHQN